jgi:hypothetical protein
MDAVKKPPSTNRNGAIILALLVGMAVLGVGFAALTGRHRAIVAQPNGIGCDYSRLRATREAAQSNPGKTAAIIAASVAASIAADKIEIQIGDRTIVEGGK